jgi:cation diffusion facilitator CzcD-associated flavoprotein CzcO
MPISMCSAEQLVERLDIVTIGAGFSSIYLLHKLRNRGFQAKTYEAADGIGGVYANHYPGFRTGNEIPYYQLDIEEVWRD